MVYVKATLCNFSYFLHTKRLTERDAVAKLTWIVNLSYSLDNCNVFSVSRYVFLQNGSLPKHSVTQWTTFYLPCFMSSNFI